MSIIQESRVLSSVAHSVISCVPPLAFWSGYTRSCLISTKFLGEYAVWLPSTDERIEDAANPESHLRLVMPRRWVDLNGMTVFSTWKSALRAVVGLLLARPLVGHVRACLAVEGPSLTIPTYTEPSPRSLPQGVRSFGYACCLAILGG
jgi:hypothetical protein